MNHIKLQQKLGNKITSLSKNLDSDVWSIRVNGVMGTRTVREVTQIIRSEEGLSIIRFEPVQTATFLFVMGVE